MFLNNQENVSMHKCFAIPCDFSPPETKACTLEEWNEAPPPNYVSADEMLSFNPDAVKAVDESIDSLNSELRELSIKIHGKCTSLSNIHICYWVLGLMISE